MNISFRKADLNIHPNNKVWASPISLATTFGIHFFSSSYLDVSVHSVPSHGLFIGPWVYRNYSVRVSSFGKIRLITLVCQLTVNIVGYDVLHRLCQPRHPPYAVVSRKYDVTLTVLSI